MEKVSHSNNTRVEEMTTHHDIREGKKVSRYLFPSFLLEASLWPSCVRQPLHKGSLISSSDINVLLLLFQALIFFSIYIQKTHCIFLDSRFWIFFKNIYQQVYRLKAKIQLLEK
jgi:hypothetical protein